MSGHGAEYYPADITVPSPVRAERTIDSAAIATASDRRRRSKVAANRSTAVLRKEIIGFNDIEKTTNLGRTWDERESCTARIGEKPQNIKKNTGGEQVREENEGLLFP